MGIYTTYKPCGCVIDYYTLGADWSHQCYPCVEHGGNSYVFAGRKAREWEGPKNPYADPEDSIVASVGQEKNLERQG